MAIIVSCSTPNISDLPPFLYKLISKGHFPLGGIFREERHFLLFKDQLAESGSQKTKENIIPRGKFRLVENDPKEQALVIKEFPDWVEL